MDFSVPIVSAAIGAVILLFGRKLFWLFVAAVGFAAGVQLAPYFVHEPTPVLALTFALVLGFVGALLALFLQKIAVAVAGFVAGGQLAVAVAATFYAQHAQYHLVIFVAGGIVGAILLLVLFDWALIVLSAVVGAHLIVGAIHLPPAGTAIAFGILALIGVLAQAGMSRRQRVAGA
ncbi:MAG: TMEM198/TM7SF3 family protein [Verrucomicrobiota bacterium]|nr:TMEM198/TM7SF3 family protein [Verrucomicrobiota bacterium]